MKTGEVVAGRFRLVRVAGTGGMGAVWEAVDEQTGARVALKVVPIEGARGHGQQARARFALEARALAELRHPNVVRYLWHGVVGSSGLVAMEWLDGRDLAGVLAGGALPPEVVLEIALGLSRALAEAHARGVVHRDVKPSNVWVSRPEGPIRAADVKLLDFGLAALRPDDETIEGPAAGTARYMAPEQARGEAPDARADYFSLGCVLYECLTGRPAFDADRTLAVLADVQSEDVPRPGARRAGLSPEIDRLVTSLLARDPADRPRGSAEVAALLGAAVGRRSPAATAGLRWVPVILGEESGRGRRSEGSRSARGGGRSSARWGGRRVTRPRACRRRGSSSHAEGHAQRCGWASRGWRRARRRGRRATSSRPSRRTRSSTPCRGGCSSRPAWRRSSASRPRSRARPGGRGSIRWRCPARRAPRSSWGATRSSACSWGRWSSARPRGSVGPCSSPVLPASACRRWSARGSRVGRPPIAGRAEARARRKGSEWETPAGARSRSARCGRSRSRSRVPSRWTRSSRARWLAPTTRSRGRPCSPSEDPRPPTSRRSRGRAGASRRWRSAGSRGSWRPRGATVARRGRWS